MGEVVDLNFETTLPYSPENVLAVAAEHEFETVTIVGRMKNGEMYYASSTSDVAVIMLHLSRMEYFLMSNDDD